MAFECRMSTHPLRRLYLRCSYILVLRIFHSAVAQIPRPVLTLHEGHIGLYDRLMETQFDGNFQPGRPYTLDIYMGNSDQFDYIIDKCVYRRRITFFDQNGCFRPSSVFLEHYESNERFPFGPMKRTIVHFYSEQQLDVRCQVRVVQCHRCAEYACNRRPLLNSYTSWTIPLAFDYEIGGCDGSCGVAAGGGGFPPLSQRLPPPLQPCGSRSCGGVFPPCAGGECGSISVGPCLADNCGNGGDAALAAVVDGCESCADMLPQVTTCSQCPFLAFGCVYQCYNCNPCFAAVAAPWYSRIPIWLWILFGVVLLLLILLLLCTICACIHGARRNSRRKVHPPPPALTGAVAATRSYPYGSVTVDSEKPRIFTVDRPTQTEKMDADARSETDTSFCHVSRVNVNADSARDQHKSYECQKLQFDDFGSIPLRTTVRGSDGGGRYSKRRLDGSSGRDGRRNCRSYFNENESTANSYGNIVSPAIRNERWEEYNETEEIKNYPLPITYRSDANSRHAATAPSRRPAITEATTVTRFSSSENPESYYHHQHQLPDYNRARTAARDAPHRAEYHSAGGNGKGGSFTSYPTSTEETFREELLRTVRQQSAF